MRRRDFVEATALTMMAGWASSCARRTATALSVPATPQPRPSVNLALPRISWERVIRTTVGLRPHRDSGFVLKAEKFDAKTLIHDYGFGGAGMSLAWGCGAMAANMALQHDERRAAVLGCGSPGLTAARQLQRRGFDVTIYTLAVPPDTTSNMSMAGFTPTAGLVSADRRTPQWDAQFREAAEISYRQLQLLSGAPGYGVYWIDSYAATEDPNPQPPAEGAAGTNPGQDLLPDQLRTGRDREVLGPGEHPFPAKYAVRTSQLSIEPSIYLEALVRDFVLFGGKIVIRKFDTPRDLMSLNESVIVNCTGLGSKTIFNDNELVPVKGQLTVCIPQPEINYRASGRMPNTDVTASLNPRSDGIIIGNMQERGNWSLEPNPDVRQQNMDAAIQFCRAMRPPSERIQLTSSGTPRGIPTIESFYGLES